MTLSEPIVDPPDPPDRPEPVGAIGARRLHPISPFIDAIAHARQLLPFLIGALVRRELWIVIAAAVALVAYRIAAWWRTTYEIGAEGLVVRRGILKRSVTSAPFARVQQVDVARKLRHQMFGVAMLRIELVGSHVDLEVLSIEQAQRIHALFATAGVPATGPTGATVPAAPGAVILAVNARDLLLGGATGATMLVAPAAVVALAQQLDEIDLFGLSDIGGADPSVSYWGAVALVVVSIVLVPGLGATISLVRNYRYRLERRGDELTMNRGLFEERRSQLRLHRVQTVRIHASALRRALGLASVDVVTAATISVEGVGSADAFLPIARVADAERIVDVALLGAEPPTGEPHPLGARRRAIVRRAVAIVVASQLLWLVGWGAVVVACAVGLPVAMWWGRAWHRRLRSGHNDRMAIVERGVWVRQREHVLLDKVQSMRVRSSPLQRRLALVSVVIDLTGSRTVTVRDIAHDAPLVGALWRAVQRPTSAAGATAGAGE